MNTKASSRPVKINFRTTAETKRKAKWLAKEIGVSLNSLIGLAVRSYLANDAAEAERRKGGA